MSEALSVFAVFPVTAERVFSAWLDGKEHAAFTNMAAEIENRPGGEFTAWNGYITGRALQLEPPFHIVQSWRTTDFPEDHPDSTLEIIIEDNPDGCQFIVNHTGLPDGRADEFETYWEDHYLSPMLGYFMHESEIQPSKKP